MSLADERLQMAKVGELDVWSPIAAPAPNTPAHPFEGAQSLVVLEHLADGPVGTVSRVGPMLHVLKGCPG